MLNLTASLPITVDVTTRGGVSVETATRVVAMGPFSPRAARLALEFGAGLHVIATDVDLADINDSTLADIADALA
jgi:hypothetical protein